MANSARDKAFISYSKDDRMWLDQLIKVLAPIQPEEIWWDGRIKAGQKWMDEIERALAAAKVAVFLVSPGFLSTEFILKVELPQLLAAEREGVTILWSLVRNCPWESSPLAGYQAIRYQKLHNMRAWNALSEAELDDLLKDFSTEIADRLRSAPAASSAEQERAEAVAPPAPRRVPSTPSPADAAYAQELLKGVDEFKTVDDIGSLFVLRQSWSAAEVAYDRMIELAAPDQESWMAWGYEKLGLIREQQKRESHARECARLAQILYSRLGNRDKVKEMELRLQKIAVSPVAEPD